MKKLTDWLQAWTLRPYRCPGWDCCPPSRCRLGCSIRRLGQPAWNRPSHPEPAPGSSARLQDTRTNGVTVIINVSPRFEWQTTISQTARGYETNHSFDRYFCLTFFRFISFRLTYAHRKKARLTVHEWERNVPKTLAASHFCRILRQRAEHSVSWQHLST